MSAAVPQPLENEEPRRAMLLLPATLPSLPIIGERLHAFAREICDGLGDAREVHDLRLAVQEACTNLIKHGRLADGDRRLALRFEMNNHALSVLITCRGEAFDPRRETALPGSADEPAEGGYGLFLIRALVDGMSYEAADGGNTLVLVKRLPTGDEA